MAYKRGPSRQGIAKARKESREERFRKIEQMRENTIRRMNKKRDNLPGGFLTGGQSKIAAKAPPTNKITGADFAVLRKEKAKGRGKGLQDEKMKPGKIMKAKKSKFIERRKNLAGLGSVLRKDPTKAINRVGVKDRYGMDIKPKTSQLGKDLASQAAKAAKATRIGKIAAGVAGVALAAKAGLEKMYVKRIGKKPFTKREKKRTLVDKKMGGGMMKKPMGYSKGMLFTMDDIIENMGKDYDYQTRIKYRKKSKEAPDQDSMKAYSEAEQDALKSVKKKYTGKMGGGMMMRPNPVGYKKGVLVKVKLGKNKPTKMY